jgi:hypothetical protein
MGRNVSSATPSVQLEEAFTRRSGTRRYRDALNTAAIQGISMRKLLIAAFVGSFCASAAIAQTAPSATTPPASKKAATQNRSPESIECSKQADAQGLKGKPRKVFRAKCKKDLMKKKA